MKQVSETLIPYETKIAELYHLWTDICNVSHASDFPDPKISKSEKSIQSRSYSNYSTCSYVSLCKKIKWPLIHSYILNYNTGIKSSYDEHSTNVIYMQSVLGVQLNDWLSKTLLSCYRSARRRVWFFFKLAHVCPGISSYIKLWIPIILIFHIILIQTNNIDININIDLNSFIHQRNKLLDWK